MKKRIFQAIIETPRGSRNKYKYDSFLNMFKLDKVLPAGFSFPYDFGFIPNTIAEDGDPLDIMVVCEEPVFTGCLIDCRIIGAITANQIEGGNKIRNDRIIAVPDISLMYKKVHSLAELGKDFTTQVEHFFISYHQYNGVGFVPLSVVGMEQALKLIEDATNGNT